MEHSENYMLVHPMELKRDYNLKQEESKLLEEQSQVTDSLRQARLFNGLGVIASIGLLGNGVYETGLNINEGRTLVAISAATSIATGIGMLRRDIIERRKTLIENRLARNQEYNARN